MRRLKGCMAAGLALVLVVSLSFAAMAKDMGMSGQNKMMAQMMKWTTPGPHHKTLEALVGKWNVTATMWMAPNTKPQVMTGTSENKWVLGGRFIQQDVMGSDAQHPFQGMGLIGYDNIRQEYTSMWADNMSTGMMESSAQYNPATSTFMESGSVSCPMTGQKNRKFRGVTKIVDADHYVFEMYMHDARGKEFKAMEIDYTRAQ